MSPVQKKYNPAAPKNWQSVLAVETLKQVEKDFALQGVPLNLKVDQLQYGELIRNLAGALENITFLNNRSLSGVLYQTDVDERMLWRALGQTKTADIYRLLADWILRRCFEKVYWRYKLGVQ